MIESKLKPGSIIAIIFASLFIMSLLIYLANSLFAKIPLLVSLPLTLFCLFFIVWLIYGELRTKALKVYIENNSITVSGYGGLGFKKDYKFSDFDGYQITILPSSHDQFEFLYLIINGKKIIKISEFYHTNYVVMKEYIIGKTAFAGEEDFDLLRELKEIFVT